MLKNYFKIAFRNLRKNPGYTFINIGGLTIGIACCLVIFQFVAFEYSFDGFNEYTSRLYRVVTTMRQNEGEPETSAKTGYAMGPALAEEVPEVARFARVHPEYHNAIVSNPTHLDRVFEEERVYYVDPTFFQIFSYPLVSGNPQRVLKEPGTVLLSESAARKYFGNEDPMGQTLEVAGWISGTFRIDGIFKDIPANSHLQFDILLPISDLLQRSYTDPSDAWGWTNFITYVQLRSGTDPAAIERKLTDVFVRHRAENLRRNNTSVKVDIQPLLDIHLNENIVANRAGVVMGSYRAVYFFTLIGLITLLIAILNYINLATARALNRAREVGVRKAIGAHKRQLVIQFLCESALTILAATALGVALAELLMPVVNNLAGTNLTSAIWTQPGFWMVFPVLFIVATLLAGLYPAFILSSFRPVAVLTGKSDGSMTGAWLRRGLVVLQFAASIVFLVGTTTVYRQLNFMRNMDLGINLEQILTVSGPRVMPDDTTDLADAVGTFIQELRQLPSVRQAATSSALPGQRFSLITNVRKAPADLPTEAGVTSIDTSFVSLYNLELVTGEGLTGISFSTPDGVPVPIIANETAIQAVGFNKPEEALGQELSVGGNPGILVGILKDFNWYSAHQAREASIFILSPGNPQISLKVNTENLPKTIAAIEDIYRQHFPGNPFRYTFADELFDQQYQNDQRFATLFRLFAGLTILIACLGLFGLAMFTAEQRTKEIGIRKVLGASVAGIVALLSKDFLKLVLIGFVIAVPIAWYAMSRWLEDFAYRIEIGPGVFLLAGLAAVLIAMATVSWQSVKAAVMNPVESLRSE